MATYVFDQVLVWDVSPGGTVRTLRNADVTVRHGLTDEVLDTVRSDANGLVRFEVEDVAIVVLEGPRGFRRRLISDDAVAAAAGFAVSEDDAVAALLASDGSASREVLDGKYAARGAVYFDIRDYGARSIFVDNRSYIQAACDAAAPSQGTVLVPAQVFNVKALAGRTISPAPGVSILGEDRRGSVLRVHASSGDWGSLICYPASSGFDGVEIRNLTLDGSTDTSPTATASSFTQSRTLINSIGADVVVEDCILKTNGVWAIHHVGDRLRFNNNEVIVDLTSYALGWFDVSALWFFSQDGRAVGNTFTAKEPTTNTFVVQTAIEFQGHNNTVADNKTATGSRFRNGVIATASTNWAGVSGFYPASPTGAVGNVIEGNIMTVTRNGVEIWGMVDTGTAPVIRGMRIRRNHFTIDNSAGAVAPACGVSFHIGTPGAANNDGPQTGRVEDLAIEGNRISYAVRRVSFSYLTGDDGVRLVTEIPVTDVLIVGNMITNCGGFGVLVNVDAPNTATIEHVDVVNDNRFVDVREPVRVVRNVNYWRVEGSTFRQTQVFATTNDNMIETVAIRPGDWASEVGGVIRNNTVRTQPTHRAYYPQRDHGIAQAYAPAARGYVVEEMCPKIQPNASTPVTLGTGMPVRRYSDGALVKPSATMGATLGTLSGVTITAVQGNSDMTVNDATNIYPGQVLALPTAVFTSPSAFVLAVVGNTVKTASGNLTFVSGKTTADAAGQALAYYGATVAA